MRRLDFWGIPLFLAWQEMIFYVMVYGRWDNHLYEAILLSFFAGMLCNLVISAFENKWAQIISLLLLTFSFVIHSAQLIYNQIFKTFFSISLVMETISDATEFTFVGMEALWQVLPAVLLMGAPMVCMLFMKKKVKDNRLMQANLVGSIIFMLLLGSMVMESEQIIENDMERMGPLVTTIRDMVSELTNHEDELDLEMAEEEIIVVSYAMEERNSQAVEQIEYCQAVSVNTEPVSEEEEYTAEVSTGDIAIAQEITEIVYEDNVLPIDFVNLAANEGNKNIRALHEYFATSSPTKKNEYTGMFEGYNLIVITAEGFSNLAVDKEITPTLYKLVNEGFVFENFYNPIWHTSTSDGEYAICTGLIPTQTNNMKKSAVNSMPFAMGWVFSDLGYGAKAYHNHSYTYYDRHLSHPNLGYEFIAPGHGMEITKVWPESDLEMMQNVVNQFIGTEPFHSYFMTVSGHLNYSFTGNSMSSKNKSYVENLEYSMPCKAYFACQKEFDLAMEYLIQALIEAGVAERTVIVICGDHYPYGLEMESIHEIAGHEVEQDFELYKSNLVIWSYGMQEPIVVDKYCSSIDILPTIYNLFGVEYDSRLFNGKDILSELEPLVVFKNKSFITDKLMYNARTKETTLLTEETLAEDYLSKMQQKVKNEWNVSASILKNDYYSYLKDYLE